MQDAIRVIAEAHRDLGSDQAYMAPKLRIDYPPGSHGDHYARIDSAILPSADVFGARLLATSRTWQGPPPKERQVYMLWRLADMGIQAIMASEWLNTVRSAAPSGLAADLLARPDARKVAMFGSSRHARGQLLSICAVRPVELVRVYSPTPAHRERFAREMSESLGVTVLPANSAEEALHDADIVCAATAKVKEVAIRGEWIREGTHVSSIGLWDEVDDVLVQRSRLFVSDYPGVFHEQPPTRPYNAMLLAGTLREEDAVELTDLVLGTKPGRRDAKEITLFASAGWALWDVAIAARVYQLARERGIGQDIVLV
jgi:ornithine cyclodeaminase/alanine dehydrogenase-like protein (mu-crystallin family)